MKIAFDTNVLLDAIANRAGYQEAQTLITTVVDQEIQGVIAASSITDIYYIAQKIIGDEDARAAIRNLLTVFDISNVNAKICLSALDAPMKDYEDAVLAVCAAQAGADYIVTRDQAFLKSNSPVPVKTPQEVLDMLGNQL